MKVERKLEPRVFQPFTVEATVETKADQDALVHLFERNVVVPRFLETHHSLSTDQRLILTAFMANFHNKVQR